MSFPLQKKFLHSKNRKEKMKNSFEEKFLVECVGYFQLFSIIIKEYKNRDMKRDPAGYNIHVESITDRVPSYESSPRVLTHSTQKRDAFNILTEAYRKKFGL